MSTRSFRTYAGYCYYSNTDSPFVLANMYLFTEQKNSVSPRFLPCPSYGPLLYYFGKCNRNIGNAYRQIFILAPPTFARALLFVFQMLSRRVEISANFTACASVIHASFAFACSVYTYAYINALGQIRPARACPELFTHSHSV